MKDRGYIDISESIRRVRLINEGNYSITEETEPSNNSTRTDNVNDNNDAVPYTMQDELMSSITQTAKTQFGADFSQSKQPMLYYPKDGDVVLSGTIGDMNDAKFQFRYKDSSGNGCYIWTSPLQITDETIRKLSVINGVFKNWKNELTSAEDIKPMGYRQNEEQQ